MTVKTEYIRRMTERRSSGSGKSLNMDEPVSCMVDGKNKRFMTRRTAMDYFLQGALMFEGTDEATAANIMTQLMLGWRRCDNNIKIIE